MTGDGHVGVGGRGAMFLEEVGEVATQVLDELRTAVNRHAHAVNRESAVLVGADAMALTGRLVDVGKRSHL